MFEKHKDCSIRDVLLGEFRGHVLTERVTESSNQWASLKLYRTKTGQRHDAFGWNGERLSEGQGVRKLRKRDPELLEVVVERLRQLSSGLKV